MEVMGVGAEGTRKGRGGDGREKGKVGKVWVRLEVLDGSG